MTTIAERLHIEPNTTVWVSDPGRIALLTPMPDGVRESDALATASTAVLFAPDAGSARRMIAENAAELDKPGTVWVVCPADTTTEVAAEVGASGDPVPVGPQWSALRLSDPAPSHR